MPRPVSPIPSSQPRLSSLTRPTPTSPQSLVSPLPLPAMSVSSAGGIITMPAPMSTEAPTFSGETSELLRFFEYFELLADSCALTDSEKCRLVVQYVDRATKWLWVTMPGYATHDYKLFRESVLDLYPGAEKGLKFTRRDLPAPRDDMSTEAELLQYYRAFRPPATWLVENKKMSAHERDHYFWVGLPTTVRRSIDRWLRLNDPDYSWDGPTDYEEVLKAGRRALSEEAFDVDFNDSIAARIRALREQSIAPTIEKRPRALHDVQTGSDDEDEPIRPNRVPTRLELDEVEDLVRKMHSLDVADPTYAVLYTRLAYIVPVAAQAWAAPRQLGTKNIPTGPPSPRAVAAFICCYYCDGPHFLRDCPCVAEHVRIGWIARMNGHLVFPDGSRIRRHPTAQNLKETVEEFHARSPCVPKLALVPHLSRC